jgi:hypothetical protein
MRAKVVILALCVFVAGCQVAFGAAGWFQGGGKLCPDVCADQHLFAVELGQSMGNSNNYVCSARAPANTDTHERGGMNPNSHAVCVTPGEKPDTNTSFHCLCLDSKVPTP